MVYKDKLNEVKQKIVSHFANVYPSLTEDDINRAFGGIIELSVGMGKTLLAIYLAHLLKLKTLLGKRQALHQIKLGLWLSLRF